MGQKFMNEVKRIQEIRDENTHVPVATLAKQIGRGEHGGSASGIQARPFYSTLSVIRRYDAKKLQAQIDNQDNPGWKANG